MASTFGHVEGTFPDATQAALDELVRQVHLAAVLPPQLGDRPIAPTWSYWLASFDEALEKAEIAAQDSAISLALALRRLRQDLDRAVIGRGATLYVDSEIVETIAVQALRLATR